MMSYLTDRRNAAIAGVVCLVVAVFAAGCGRPPDEAWLRFLGFSQGESTSGSLASITGALQDNQALTADANFENRSLNVGQTGGVGVLVYRARVDYRLAGYAPPPDVHEFTLYLQPRDEGQTGAGTLYDFPLVPVALKHWLINSGVNASVVELTAQVTFFAQADDGAEIETAGSIRIALTNSR